MERPTPPPPNERELRIVALCDAHLDREETLLADMLHSLRQVRDAFFERNLSILPTLHRRQEILAREAAVMAAVRMRLREVLADLLAMSPDEATLRVAALAVSQPARGRLLQRHAQLCELVRQADRLAQQNAALLGYAREFLASLFADPNSGATGERYGPLGERRGVAVGSLLEARV